MVTGCHQCVAAADQDKPGGGGGDLSRGGGQVEGVAQKGDGLAGRDFFPKTHQRFGKPVVHHGGHRGTCTQIGKAGRPCPGRAQAGGGVGMQRPLGGQKA